MPRDFLSSEANFKFDVGKKENSKPCASVFWRQIGLQPLDLRNMAVVLF